MPRHFWNTSTKNGQPDSGKIRRQVSLNGKDGSTLYMISGTAYKNGQIRANLLSVKQGTESLLLDINATASKLVAKISSGEDITAQCRKWIADHNAGEDALDSLVGFCDAYAWQNYIKPDTATADDGAPARGKHIVKPERTVRKRPSNLVRK